MYLFQIALATPENQTFPPLVLVNQLQTTYYFLDVFVLFLLLLNFFSNLSSELMMIIFILFLTYNPISQHLY